MPDGGSFVGKIFAAAIRPNPPLTVSQWADKHRKLTAKGASEPGPWRTSRVPFLREIMAAAEKYF
jgi:phage terminase large subunit GpA-like protein